LTKQSPGYPCFYCSTPVRNRFVTYVIPDSSGINIEVHSHGKCRWMPELWDKLERIFKIERDKYETSEGEWGEIITFGEVTI